MVIEFYSFPLSPGSCMKEPGCKSALSFGSGSVGSTIYPDPDMAWV